MIDQEEIVKAFCFNKNIGSGSIIKTKIVNIFATEDDCDMFIMVLKQQWPKCIGRVPTSTLEIAMDISRQLASKDYKRYLQKNYKSL